MGGGAAANWGRYVQHTECSLVLLQQLLSKIRRSYLFVSLHRFAACQLQVALDWLQWHHTKPGVMAVLHGAVSGQLVLGRLEIRRQGRVYAFEISIPAVQYDLRQAQTFATELYKLCESCWQLLPRPGLSKAEWLPIQCPLYVQICQPPLVFAAVMCAVEMNYDALSETEPAGEVLLRGPQLFSGYYKQVRGCDAQLASIHIIQYMACNKEPLGPTEAADLCAE